MDLKHLKLEYSRCKGTQSRSQADADFDDIVAAFDALDAECLLPQMFCSSEDILFLPASLPHHGPEELVSELRPDLVSKVENLDQSAQSIVKPMRAASTGN